MQLDLLTLYHVVQLRGILGIELRDQSVEVHTAGVVQNILDHDRVNGRGDIHDKRREDDRDRGVAQDTEGLSLGTRVDRIMIHLIGDNELMLGVIDTQEQESEQGTQRDTGDRRRDGIREQALHRHLGGGIDLAEHRALCSEFVHAELHHEEAHRQTADDLDQHFDDLTARGGEHVALSLKIAAVDRDQTADEDRRRQRHHRIDRIGRFDQLYIDKADTNHQHKADRAHRNKELLGGFIDDVHIPIPLLRDALRDQTRYRDRESRRRQREKRGVDLIGVAQQTDTDTAHREARRFIISSKHTVQEDLVQHAEHLDHDHADGHDHRAL